MNPLSPGHSAGVTDPHYHAWLYTGVKDSGSEPPAAMVNNLIH